MAIEPDTKDWTWVLHQPCTQCGTDTSAHSPATITGLIADVVPRWREVLGRPDVRRRADESIWAPLEYAAHVSEVCRVFTDRLALMLDEDTPTFADWDQDAAAVEGGYRDRRSSDVAAQLEVNATRVAAAFAAVPRDRWERPGLRSDGSAFTVRTLSRYFAHDVLHHLHDVGG